MKKLGIVLVVGALVVCLAACGGQTPVSQLPQTPITTQPPQITQTQPAETTVPATQPTTEPTTQPTTAPTVAYTEEGLRTEFLAAMDSYEAFIDEYIAFMAKNYVDPATFSAECADMMARYTQETEAFYRWDAENMSEAEYAYNMEVQTRVHQKLMDVGLES